MGSTNPVHAPWELTVARKRKVRDQSIAHHANTAFENTSITDVDDITTLAAQIRDGKLKAVDVTSAFTQRAVTVHAKTNCLTEILFDDALHQAKKLDEYYQAHGQTIGSLHGVVMTLKDQFDVQDYDTTIGYVGRAFKPATDDALLVQILRELGAVFIAKTNLPQSIMWCETDNPLWGLTTHHLNPAFTPGGSTGGEGVLLANHGSLLGWGTDIGGSVRIPAHMSGLYSLKPSSGRFPYEGVPVSTSGQEHVPSVVGPMARSLSSIEYVTRLVIEAKPWDHDPTCHRIPFQQDIYTEVQTRPLVIGLLLDDGHVKVHPPIERIVREAAMKLQAAGHIIVPWTPDGHTECIEIMDLYYTADGGEDIKRDVAAGGEPYIPHVEALINRAPAISVYEYWGLNRRKRAAQKRYLEKWNSIRDSTGGRKVDVLLAPVMPHSAVPHRCCKWVGYTKVWNLLDYTAAVIPGGKVDAAVDLSKDDPAVSAYQPRNELDKWNWNLYDPDAMHGFPVGLQIVGQRLEEEKVLGAAKVIDDVLRAGSNV